MSSRKKMPKKGCKKKSKNSNKIRLTVISEAPPYLQAAEISDLEMAETTEPVPEPDPEPVSDLGWEAMDKAAEGSSVKQHEVMYAPATGANEATEPVVSERAEVATEAPAILPEPVVVEYDQPNIRWVGNDNPVHRRVGLI
jgi:hypothetical protein